MEHNPYSAPTVNVRDVSADADVELAGKGRRLANLVIDSFSHYAIAFIVALVMALAVPGAADAIVQHSFLFSIATMFCYYVLCEALFGRTLAKLMTGTKVVTETGEAPRLSQVILRTLARLVPFEPFSCLGDPPIGWHDQWSGIRVVRTTPGNTMGPAFSLQNSADSSPPSGSLGLR